MFFVRFSQAASRGEIPGSQSGPLFVPFPVGAAVTTSDWEAEQRKKQQDLQSHFEEGAARKARRLLGDLVHAKEAGDEAERKARESREKLKEFRHDIIKSK